MLVSLVDLEIGLYRSLIEHGTNLAYAATEILLKGAVNDNACLEVTCGRSPLTDISVEGEGISGIEDQTVELLTGDGDVMVPVAVGGRRGGSGGNKTEIVLDVLAGNGRLLDLSRHVNDTRICSGIKESLDIRYGTVHVHHITPLGIRESECETLLVESRKLGINCLGALIVQDSVNEIVHAVCYQGVLHFEFLGSALKGLPGIEDVDEGICILFTRGLQIGICLFHLLFHIGSIGEG